MRKIDLNTWNRKEHFEFFNGFDEPFFGIVADVDCTKAYHYCKQNKLSFFLYYLHKAIIAVNEMEEFRYRVIDDKVVCFDVIHVSSTIGRKDNTFAVSFIEYNSDFDIFSANANKEIDAVNNSTGMRLNSNGERHDVIHFSPLPWVNFTALSHARNYKFKESIPKISVGKYTNREEQMLMPVSIHAHHGLMDGYHAGKYLELFQNLLNENR